MRKGSCANDVYDDFRNFEAPSLYIGTDVLLKSTQPPLHRLIFDIPLPSDQMSFVHCKGPQTALPFT